jgi:hypothetical protein
MSLYDDASLILYPSGYKAGTAYSLKPTDGSGDLTFTRASDATRVNAEGLIESVATGVPRIDYTGGGCAKLLLQPQRTNLMRNSEQLNSWLKLDISVTSNSTTSPDGTQNADTITATGAGSLSHLIYQNLAFTSGTSYTLSVFAKANTSDYIQLVFAGQLIANSYANFDLSSGTITASAFLTAKIENYGNGWYRCSVSATAGASLTNSQIVYLINSGTASRGQSFVQSGESVYLWGGSFENGSFPTSYIPTTTTAVTRVADAASKTGISSLIGQTEGTLFAEVEILNNALGWILDASDGTQANRTLFFKLNNNQIRFLRNSTTQSSSTSLDSPILSLGVHKIALAYQSGNTAFFIDGVQISTTNTATFTNGTLNKISLGTAGDGSGNQLGDRISQALLFKTRLTNAELATLTTL